MNKGLFIVLEGGEGSGKTSVAKLLKEKLENLGQDVIITREPGGVDVAEDIRDIIMENKLNPISEALLFAAARREHLDHKVLPAINNDTIVICDRYIDSSIVYQGGARKLGEDKIRDLNLWATDNILPDLTFFLDVRPTVGLARIACDENREINRFDDCDIEFHNDLYSCYNKLFLNRDNSHIINGEQKLEVVVDDIIKVIMEYING